MNFDSFSSSQIQSKIWLVEELEKCQLDAKKQRIWILAGWYGLTNFIIRTRGRIPILEVRSFDSDPECEPIADKINNLWEWQQWQFKAHTADVNELEYKWPFPDIVINTSVEHMESDRWWDLIPAGTLVALQACDLDHDEHTADFKNLQDLVDKYPMTFELFTGTKVFDYGSKRMSRFMLIGRK